MDNRIPNPVKFFKDVPLYNYYEISEVNYNELQAIESFEGTIDIYCLGCNKDAVFRLEEENFNSIQGIGTSSDHFGATGNEENEIKKNEFLIKRLLADRIFTKTFVCTRNESHLIYFVFKIIDKKICKIGQYPSLADIQSSYLEEYRSALDRNDYRELIRATGLNAHGIGIGSFVYLRRIFERLISSIYTESSINIVEEDFKKKRIEDKILLLKDFLPLFLVENRKIYFILSKGIHDLEEDECQKYFESVKGGIEIILDERIAKKKFEMKKSKIAKSLQGITGAIKNKSS